ISPLGARDLPAPDRARGLVLDDCAEPLDLGPDLVRPLPVPLASRLGAILDQPPQALLVELPTPRPVQTEHAGERLELAGTADHGLRGKPLATERTAQIEEGGQGLGGVEVVVHRLDEAL